MSTPIRLGTQGWTYPDWVGPFLPEGSRPPRHLSLYAQAFDTVEVDSTFYAVPSERTIRAWHERSRPGFVFSLKLPREITHERRLRDAARPLAEFLERARLLEDRLGPLLIQLGPDFAPTEEAALFAFLDLLPHDLRFAVEFRQRGWITGSIHERLKERGVAICLSEGQWLPRGWVIALAERPTAGFHYVRWMGFDRSITDFSHEQIDRSDELDEWAGVLRHASERVSGIFGYFNNYYSGHAPAAVRALQRRLGQEPVEPRDIGEQTALF